MDRKAHSRPQLETFNRPWQARQIRRLERELQKKEKALSEAATLL